MRWRRSAALRLNIRFCDLLGANLATSIRAERQAEQEAQAGRYRTFCDRLNPCFDKLLLHLKQLRPFLGPGDFAPGAFGHNLVDALQPADYTVEKVAYSAFYQTRLEYILRAIGVDTLLIGGIVTNGGVASTLRDAHLRNIDTVLLSDGCAAFRPEVHDATLLSLSSLGAQMTCAQATALLEART